MKIRLIAMDMDGTLLNDKGGISDHNLRALFDAQKAGITVAICTGRFPENAGMIIKDAGLTCPVIGVNGGLIELNAGGEALCEHVMDKLCVQAVYEALEECGNNYHVFSFRSVVTRQAGIKHHSLLQFGERIQKDMGVRYGEGEEAVLDALAGDVFKFYVENRPDPAALEKARALLSPLPGIFLTRSGKNNIEIMPAGIDKESGVRELAAYLSIPLDQVMTLGDENNDLSMIRAAGCGVAMGNATDEVKNAAKYVTDNCLDDGVARAIRALALCEKDEEFFADNARIGKGQALYV